LNRSISSIFQARRNFLIRRSSAVLGQAPVEVVGIA
jgi:hypothetical protein